VINDRLAALDRATRQQDEPGLLDALPMLGDALAEMPASIQARLFAAFGLELIYNKQDPPGHHLRHHPSQHPGHARGYHRRQPATGRTSRIGPFFTAPQNNTRFTFLS